MASHGDEHYETIDKIAGVLQQHIAATNPNRPKDDAHHFRAAYLSFLDDFWSKEEAAVALENLSRAVQKVCDAHENLPGLILDELRARAVGLDGEHREEFLKSTTADNLFSPAISKLGTDEAVNALNTLVGRRKELLSVISIVKKELPEGMRTRNRPGPAWAVIHAANAISASGRKINVPKSMDRSGPFYRLLVDMFELFEIDTSVSGAFRGWRTHMADNYENLDLMPI